MHSMAQNSISGTGNTNNVIQNSSLMMHKPINYFCCHDIKTMLNFRIKIWRSATVYILESVYKIIDLLF